MYGIPRFRGAAVAAVAFVMAAGAAPAQTQVKSGFNLFSPEQDIEIGRQSAAEAERQLPMLRDPRIEGYVEQVGRRLAGSAPGPKFPYTFHVVNASDMNAFALPGGPVYVTRGMIDAARNEGELASVIAHEIAHVALRHGTNQVSKAYLAKAGIGILGGVLGGGGAGGTGQILQAVGGLGLNALFLKFSRTAETQADIVGTQVMARAGYDPLAMASMFQLLKAQAGRDPGRVAQFFSDHPSPANREVIVRQEAQKLGVRGGRLEVVGGFDSVKSELRRLGPAPTMAQISRGVASGSTSSGSSGSTGAPASRGTVAQPSTRMRTFRHRSGFFEIQYPENWRVAESSGYGATLLPEGGAVRTSNGQDVLVYGVVINHYEPFAGSPGDVFGRPVQGQGTLEQAMNDLVNQLIQANPHLRVVPNSTRRQTIDNARALSVVLAGRSPVTGQEERVTVFTRELPDGHVIYALFIAPARDYSALASTFQKMISTLRVNDESYHSEHAAQ
ncbi:MAG TPA: M48 family metallopeptidase [Thermoanaerobaculia bacterium]|jgi:Zn-dependent protease with chaperone function|nr:M48 family metallopeptidase [Thermoanaerobaculia bacterium]